MVIMTVHGCQGIAGGAMGRSDRFYLTRNTVPLDPGEKIRTLLQVIGPTFVQTAVKSSKRLMLFPSS